MPEDKGDNLEHFFRKGFSSYDIAYKEEDWQQLEGRLYEVDRAFMAGFQRGAVLFGSLLLILAGFFTAYLIYNSWGAQTGEPSLTEQPADAEHSADRSGLEQQVERPEEIQTDDRSEHTPSLDEQPEVNQPDETQSIEVLPRDEELERGDLQDQESAYLREFTVDNGETEEGGESTMDTDQDKRISDDEIKTQEWETLIPVGNFPSYLYPELALNFPLPAVDDSVRIDKGHRFSWIVTVSPESSMVGVNGFFKPTPAVSALVEFKIIEDLWVHTGVNYSEKLYSAHQREYQPPKGFWTRGVVPETTEGMCQLIDIPINLNYNFSIGDHNQLHITAGTSSYLLLFQDYEYIYTSNDPDLIRDWIGRRNSIYPFQFINAGIGYSGGISEKLDFVVGPYIKVPTTNIGHGNINMTTVGINMGLRIKKIRLKPINID